MADAINSHELGAWEPVAPETNAPCDRSRSVVAHAGCDLREDWPSGSRWISLRRRGVRLTGGSLLISFGTGTSARSVTAGPSIHRPFASLPAQPIAPRARPGRYSSFYAPPNLIHLGCMRTSTFQPARYFHLPSASPSALSDQLYYLMTAARLINHASPIAIPRANYFPGTSDDLPLTTSFSRHPRNSARSVRSCPVPFARNGQQVKGKGSGQVYTYAYTRLSDSNR